MGTVTHISCPACKGAVGITAVDRVVSCAYCDVKLLVDSPGFVPQYYVPAVHDEIFARRRLQRFLTQKFLPKGLLHNARFSSATLCYVPFHEFFARRVGTIEMTVEKVVGSRLVVQADPEGNLGATFKTRKQKTASRETEVVMGDIHRIEPAVTLERFGLDYCGIFDVLKQQSEVLSFTDSVRHQKHTRVYAPTISADSIVQQLELKGFSTSVADDTTYMESRTRLVYYPLWRLRYRFAGRLYNAVMDGVTGKLLVARAPEGDQMRVMTLLAGITVFGLLLGPLIRSASLGEQLSALARIGAAGFFGPLLTMMALLIGGMGLVWALVWGEFRYPGEVCQQGDDIHVEKYNSLLRRRIRLPLLTPASLIRLLFQKGA
ncbi:MAG: hypothetical protein JXX29_12450 [Deltaproteobacteria bacterium]|nr:hypothetical protein [Deltaproteobacteria bacterium]MBN2672485.1 hypothetical protein [Deltaproteobacteria bacterium]